MAMIDVAASILGLEDFDCSSLSHEELGEFQLGLQQAASLLDAKIMLCNAHAKQRGVGHHDKVRNNTKWLTAKTRRREYTVGSDINTAHDVVFGLPDVHDAYALAMIHKDHVRSIRSVYRIPRFREAAVRDQELFLEWAHRDSFPTFESKMAMWMVVNDPIDPATQDEVDFDARGLRVVKGFGNTVLGDLCMPTEMWEQFLTFVQPRFDRMWAEDWAEAKERVGEDVTPDDLWRTDKQRWVDAMMEAIRSSTGDARNADYIVNLVCDSDTFREEFERHAAQDLSNPIEAGLTNEPDVDDTPIPWDERDSGWGNRRCETESGLPVSPNTVLMAAMYGRVRRVIVHADYLGLEMSESVRLFRGNLRLGIKMRDRHCRGPGCSTHASECVIDHIQPHSRGGPTTPTNGQALCKPCHRYKTRLEALGIL